MSRRRVTDAVCVVLIACAAYLLGVGTITDGAKAGKQPMFYQRRFAPAVMLACGYGYRNVDENDNPALLAFLTTKQDAFDCASASPPASGSPLDSFQSISRYFESTVALVWRLRGIRWSALLPLFGLMVTAAAIATYGLLRVVSPPIVAFIGTFLTAFSPMAIANLPNLRDYAKAPFVLGLLWIFAAVLRRPHSGRAFVALAAAAALLEGVGLGFRTDLWLMLPLIVLVFATARMQAPFPGRVRAAAAVCFVALLAAIAWPIVRGYARGSNTAHVVLLGFAAPFDASLQVEPANYTLGSLYNDDYMYARVGAFAELNAVKPPSIGTPEYDHVSGEYLGQVIRMFPGDVATRAVAAFVGVLRSPFASHAAELAYVRAPLQRAFAIRDRIVFLTSGLVEIVVAAMILGAVLFAPLPAVVALLVFLVLSSAAMLQFHPRHFFYVEVLIWLPVCAAVANVGALRHLDARRIRRSGVVAAIAVFVGGPIAAASAVYIARSIQQRETDEWLARLRSATLTPLAVRTEPISADKVRLVVPDIRPDEQDVTAMLTHPVTAARYAVVVGGPSCDRLSVPLTFRYRSTVPFDDFTEQETVPLPVDGGEVTLYISAFDFDAPAYVGRAARPTIFGTRFVGIETDPGSARCIEHIDAVPERVWPQPVTAVTDAPGASWHERLDWEPARNTLPYIATVPAGMSRAIVLKALNAPLEGRIEFAARAVRATGSSWRVDGHVDGPFTYLLTLAARRTAEGDFVIVKGTIGHGGVMIGLQQHETWSESVNVTKPGPFLVALTPPSSGDYQLVVANCLFGGATSNDVLITTMGWASR